MEFDKSRFFPSTLIISLLVGATSVFLLFEGTANYLIPLAAIWLFIFVIALAIFRKQALWLLFGAPFALGPLLLIWLYMYECIPTK